MCIPLNGYLPFPTTLGNPCIEARMVPPPLAQVNVDSSCSDGRIQLGKCIFHIDIITHALLIRPDLDLWYKALQQLDSLMDFQGIDKGHMYKILRQHEHT